MYYLCTMGELIKAGAGGPGLGRFTSGLGVYTGPTVVTIDDLKPMRPEEILWVLRLLPLPDHQQKVICVKTAVYAAELVAHLTNDHPHATKCLDAARAWLDNPCEETRAEARGAERSAKATDWAVETARIAATEWVETAWVSLEWVVMDSTTTPKIKAYLIDLIRELS